MFQHIPCVGDSQSDTASSYARAARQWPFRLQQHLRALGAPVYAGAYGVSGDTTANILDRLHGTFRYCGGSWGDSRATPQPLAVIYAAVNDPGASISQATTQKNIEAMVMAYKHGAFGTWETAHASRGIAPTGPCYAATVAALPADGRIGMRMVVLSDTDSGQGVAANAALVAAGRQAASVAAPASSGAVTVWEWRTGKAGNLGWGRVVNASSATPTWCSRVIVISTNYLNWTTGGDTPAGGTPGGAPYSSYPSVRTAQAAAVTAQQNPNSGLRAADPWVIYTDLFGYQKALIVSGVVPNFSADTTVVPTTAYDAAQDWHYLQNNQHHGAYGHQTVLEAIANGGTAGTALPTAWITALAS